MIFSEERGKGALDRLKAQVFIGLINEGVLLEEIENLTQNQFAVSDGCPSV